MSTAQQHPRPSASTRILILGGGFGGRYAAQRLALRLGRQATVTIVDRNDFLLYTPMLTEAAGGAVHPRNITAPLRNLRGVQFVQGEITAADLHAKTVTLATGQTLTADHIILALGSTTNYRDIPGAREHSLTLKTLADAEKLYAQALYALPRAAAATSPGERKRLLTFVVAGGGYTGVESMAALRELLYERAPQHGIHPSELRLVVIEPTGRLMAEMPEPLGNYGKDTLTHDGVDVRLNIGVKTVESEKLTLTSGETLPYGLLLWDTGIVPSPLLKSIDCPKGKHGGITTDSCFQVPGLPGIWALGDCAETPNPKKPGKTFAPTAQNSTRAGTHVADNIVQQLRGRPVRPFTYQQVGELALVSGHDGVAHVFGISLQGPLAWLMWRIIYIAKMPTTPKRLALLTDYLRPA